MVIGMSTAATPIIKPQAMSGGDPIVFLGRNANFAIQIKIPV